MQTFKLEQYTVKILEGDLDHTVCPARQLWNVEIQGPLGGVRADNLVWIAERWDYIDELYREITACLDGEYHCCFTGRSLWL